MIKKYILAVIFLITLWPSVIMCQGQQEALKAEAKKEMLVGRYGEAIDLLNRYISAHPQEAEGYNLRGLCYEKRAQFDMAVYDFRSARKLLPQNTEINKNLSRATDSWYKLLYNKIEGHKREIALFPKVPLNYLEIGKSYKNLGEWLTAEQWYDKYLTMEAASPDEIIRYTEILAKNNHIAKGEPILKKYTDQYPNDNRLWSRYGYFELWLGKTKNAIFAFEKALALKPYFKEAMDGLDQAKGNGYIYTINDTSYKYGVSSKEQKPQEYAIDKYYRILKNKPDDNETRFALIDELIKNNRIEESAQQLAILHVNPEVDSSDRFKEKLAFITSYRDSLYSKNMSLYLTRFQNNNKDKEAAVMLANTYEHLFDFDNAIDVLNKYLADKKDNEDLDVRFQLAKYNGWSYKWDNAFNQMGLLMKYDPTNLKYKLFNAQLVGWNILDAKPDEVERAKGWVNDVLKDDPQNLYALMCMCYLYVGKGNIVEATEYLNKAKVISPGSKDVQALEDYINTRTLVENEKEIFKMRGQVAKYYEEGNFDAAADKYDEIMAKLENPDKDIILECARYNSDAKRYDAAVKAYDKALKFGPDVQISSLIALNTYCAGDSTKALEELDSLKIQNPYDYSVNYCLGEVYERMKKNDEARNLYVSLVDASDKGTASFDTSQISAMKIRIRYLTIENGPYAGSMGSSSGSLLGSLLSYLAISPVASVYSDNQNFIFTNYGGRVETGLLPHLSIGASYLRYVLYYNPSGSKVVQNLSSFIGHLLYSYGYFSSSLGFGTTQSVYSSKKYVTQFNAKFTKDEEYGLGFQYEKNDAKILLYSPFLIYSNIYMELYRFYGNYNFSNGMTLSSRFSFIKIGDSIGNEGNDFQIRAGKAIDENINIGYEYYYVNFARTNTLYYSPQNYETHSIWADWKAYKDEEIKVTIGGKLGYTPSNDFISREIYGDVVYHPINTITLSGRISAGSSFRYDSSYSYIAAYLIGYINIL